MSRAACLVVLAGACTPPGPIVGPPPGAPSGWAALVNPFIGTDPGAPDFGIGNAGGNTFPGAVWPFGMVAFSPDTTRDAGGYRYGDREIEGFSLTHFSGRGSTCYQDVAILPQLGPLSTWSRPARARFRHENEAAWPGAYGVRLDDGIAVELTAGPRFGMARFTFPPTDAAVVTVDVGASANGDDANGTAVEVASDDTLVGSAQSGFCGNPMVYRVFFAARFDRPFSAFGTWMGDALAPGAPSASGSTAGAYVAFDTRARPVVTMKVGLSFVSVEKAAANLDAELRDWDFDAARARALAAWNRRLGAVKVQGGDPAARHVFYTALYHALIHPSLFSDDDGETLGFDGRDPVSPRPRYHNLATWDQYRAQMPLVALLAPDVASDVAQSLVDAAMEDPGGGMPRWGHANSNSGGMTGDGPVNVLAALHAFGARFDEQAALAAMERHAAQPETTSAGYPAREGLADDLAHGFVTTACPYSASRTLEYAIADFALSRFAEALGDTARRDHYASQAQAWRNLAHGGYLQPRDPDGAFPAFDPAGRSGYIEGSGAQYSWLVPFAMRTLASELGGDPIARLDRHFGKLNDGPGSELAFLGNEPELFVPWAYAFLGAPHRTQAVVRRALVELYHDAPNGVAGNDDGGAMAAWVVFGSLGLYPAIPGVAGFVVGSPRFPDVIVTLAGGDLHIVAPAAADDAPYVHALALDGASWPRAWIPWSSLAGGATLDFTLASDPDPSWAADPNGAPPSF